MISSASLKANIVSSVGTCLGSLIEISKGILFSDTTFYAYIMKAADNVNPTFEQKSSNCFFKSESILKFTETVLLHISPKFAVFVYTIVA